MWKLVQDGWSLLGHHKKALFFLYLSNLLTASLLLIPFVEAFENSLGSGLYREKLVEELDYDWYRLFQDRATGIAGTFSPAVIGLGPFARNLNALLEGTLASQPWDLLAIGAVYLLATAFLLAAAVGSFALDPRGTSMREFFRTGGLFFGRFFRLTLLTVFGFWLLSRLFGDPLWGFLDRAARWVSTDKSAFYLNLAGYLVVALVVLFVNMVSDYAKIKTAAEDRTSIVLAYFSALSFCVEHFFRTYSFYLFLTAAGLLWVAAYVGVDYLLDPRSGLTILLVFLWQQIFIVGRLALKLIFYTSQLQLYLGHRA